MDPDETLAEIRRLVVDVLADDCDDADPLTLAQAVEDLDQWLCDGGFLPGRWRPGEASFVVAFSCDNAAFEGLGNIEIARILRHVHDEVLVTEDEVGPVRDRNGNTVGTWRYHHG